MNRKLPILKRKLKDNYSLRKLEKRPTVCVWKSKYLFMVSNIIKLDLSSLRRLDVLKNSSKLPK
jgi:hypothetical protein